MKWFTDGSDLKGIKDAALPDIVLFGGLAVDLDTELSLQKCIEQIKGKYGEPRAPVKWNMRDLEPLYKKHNDLDRYKTLLKESEQWRAAIFECIASHKATFIVACIEGYSARKDVLLKTKEGLVGMAFNNGLMRYGLHVKETGARGASVVMDWPDGGDPTPFTNEYSSAYRKGITPDGIKYFAGPLCNLHFSDTPSFTYMRHSTMLQTADMVVGAVRELVECCLGKRGPGHGVACLKAAKDRFKGAPNKVLGHGLSISSGNAQLLEKVDAGLKKHL